MNWKNVKAHAAFEPSEVLFRIVKANSTMYITGRIMSGNIYVRNSATTDDNYKRLCSIAEIGSGEIDSVQFIDPREILP